MHLAHIAETTRFDTLKKTAGELVRDAAAARGPSGGRARRPHGARRGPRTQRDDRALYGERVLVVGCDASLRPVVREKTKTGTRAPGAQSAATR